MELEASGVQRSCRGSLNMAPVNKVHHVRTIALVAAMLGEDEDWLCDVANEMDQEDGFGLSTPSGSQPTTSEPPLGYPNQRHSPAAHAGWLPRFCVSAVPRKRAPYSQETARGFVGPSGINRNKWMGANRAAAGQPPPPPVVP